MPDRGTFWTAPVDTATAVITGEGLHIAPVPARPLVLASGDLAAFAEVAGDLSTAIPLARGRILWPAQLPEGLAWGWDTRGFALSDATALYQAVHVGGDQARALIARGMDADPDQTGGSAAFAFAGQKLVIRPEGDGYLLLVEAPLFQWLWSWLNAATAAMS